MEYERIIFLDSNFWIYLFDETTPEHPYIRKYFSEIYETSILAVNLIVMIEVIHYLVKRLGVPTAKKKWELFSTMALYYENLNFEDLDSIFSELCNYSHLGIGGRDATIISFLKSYNIKKICTHDKSFKQITEIEVIDPIPENLEKL